MPLVITDTITRPEQLVEYMASLLQKEEALNLKHVARYDELLTPEYPAVIIQPGQFQKAKHGTGTYMHTLRANLYVCHANLTESKQQRSLQDCILATQVIEVLERDQRFGGRIIDGFVESDLFAPLPPRSQKSSAVVSTRLTWQGRSQSRFEIRRR